MNDDDRATKHGKDILPLHKSCNQKRLMRIFQLKESRSDCPSLTSSLLRNISNTVIYTVTLCFFK